MNQENLSDGQIDQLQAASLRLYDELLADGEPTVELRAAMSAEQEVGLISIGSLLGTTEFLYRQSRQRLYGPNAKADNLDPQG